MFYVCLRVCMCSTCMQILTKAKRSPGSGVTGIVSHLIEVLAIEPGSLEKQCPYLLSHLQPHISF